MIKGSISIFELFYIIDRFFMTAMLGLIKWCEDEVIRMNKDIKQLEDGKMIINSIKAGGIEVDETKSWIKELKIRVFELNQIIASN